MKKKTGLKDIIKALSESSIDVMVDIKYGIIKNLKMFAILLLILFPAVIAEINMGRLARIISMCLLILFVRIIGDTSNKLNRVTAGGIPVPKKRFTRVDENGFIDINQNNMQEAILYLYEVENYLKKKGKLD